MLIPHIRSATALAVMLAPALVAAQPATGTQPAGGQPSGAQSPGSGSQPTAPSAGGELQTFQEKLSYGLGLNAGRMLQQRGMKPDRELFIRGFRDSYKQGTALLTDQQINQIFAKATQQMQAKAAAAKEKQAAQWNKAFSQQPAAGAQSTASGLSYSVIEKGQGPKPKANDFVSVHYVGKFPSGEVFDSSLKRGQPAVFQLGRVIPGWTEGLQLMSPGAKYRFEVPAKLGYREEGYRSPATGEVVIPPNQDLIFEVELLKVMPANQAPGGNTGAAGGNAAGNAAGGNAGTRSPQ